MQIRELMKKNPHAVTDDLTLQEAAQKMSEIECGVLPVVEGDRDAPGKKPVGIITDRDIVCRSIAEGIDPSQATVAEAFTKTIVTCNEDCTAQDAFKKMRAQKVGRLMVVDKKGELCGIVSMADIIERVPVDILNQLPGSKAPQPRNKAA